MSKELLVRVLNDGGFEGIDDSVIGTVVPAIADPPGVVILGKYLGSSLCENDPFYFSIINDEVEIVKEVMNKEVMVKILNNGSYRDMNASRIGTIVPAVIDGEIVGILGKYLGIKMDQDRYYCFSILRNEVEIVEETAANDEVLVGDHYTLADGTNTMDTIKAIVGNKAGLEAFFVGNIVKYIARYEKKNGVDDVRKAKDYCERLIKLLEEREDEDEQE